MSRKKKAVKMFCIRYGTPHIVEGVFVTKYKKGGIPYQVMLANHRSTTIPMRYLRTWEELSNYQKELYVQSRYELALDNIDWEIAKDPTLKSHGRWWREGAKERYERACKPSGGTSL